MRKLFDLFRIDTSDVSLVRAQLTVFSKQIPLLYAALAINAAFCIASFAHEAPHWVSVYLPLTIIAICVGRMIVWLRTRGEILSDEKACRQLKGVVIIGGVLTVIVVVWFLGLYLTTPSAVSQLHAALALALTMVSCMLCLLHLRTAVLMVGLAAVPFSIVMFVHGDMRHATIALNMMLAVLAVVYVLTVASKDFDRMIRLSNENARLANLDVLTELPNRRAFFDRLETVLRRISRSRKPIAVGVLDLDGFKAVNDLFGHITGDRLLIEAGKRLRTVAGEKAYICRLGGDEFAMIVSDVRDPHELTAFGESLCAAMAEPFILHEASVNVSASIGFAVYPVAGDNAELLYERADYALYHAKTHRRGQPSIFSDTHESEIREQRSVEQALRGADFQSELTLFFQPLIDVDRGVPTGFEALARWNSRDLGPVPPGIFVPIAERTDLIFTITHTLLRKALDAARSWPPELRVSFNLSARDIVSKESIEKIEAIVRSSDLDPGRIEFEITESSLLSDFRQALASIETLRALGASVVLDDFGTGYSSLSYVHRLPLDKIKVDRSFVMDIESRDASRDILKTVIDLCSNLAIACVVEGTETRAQTEIVRGLGCTSMQGYYFAKPMPLSDVPGFLARMHAAEAARAESTVAGEMSTAIA